MITKLDNQHYRMPRPPEEEQSHANYGVLIELKDSVLGMGVRFDKFASEQQVENKHLHARIDATQEKFVSSFSTLKDGMAERGRITPPLLASVISMVAILCGAGAAYVSMTTAPLERTITENTAKIAAAEAQRLGMNARLQDLAVASMSTDARSEVDRQWITKLLDETRNAPTSTSTSRPPRTAYEKAVD